MAVAAEGVAKDKAAVMSIPASATVAKASASAPAAKAKVIDINTASRDDLKTLPGIGDAEADRIVAGRPYTSKANLVTKNVLPEGVFLSIRHSVTVQSKSTKRAQTKVVKP
jgi:DNA uptake protein ComE-like DNA-binding protein